MKLPVQTVRSAGFAFILSDAAFGSTPCKMGYDINEIRVGDILRINDNTHSVVVLAIDGIPLRWQREITMESYTGGGFLTVRQ